VDVFRAFILKRISFCTHDAKPMTMMAVTMTTLTFLLD
jgi:hypothetical protein